MLISVRQFVHRLSVTAALGLACVPEICHAQESTTPLALTTPLGTTPPPSLSTTNDLVVDEPTGPHNPSLTTVTETAPSRPGILLPLYVSYAGLQMLDAHSTMRALRNGGTESNPLLRNVAGRPAALFALKAGVTASTILLTERLRPKNRVGAIVLMAALDSFYATVVVHNYRATP